MISLTDRTRTELAANRRRHRRNGVALMHGEPPQWVLLPIDSVRAIPVRPAFRVDRLPDGPRELAGAFLEGFFSNRFLPWTVCGVVLLLAIAAFNHFHP